MDIEEGKYESTPSPHLTSIHMNSTGVPPHLSPQRSPSKTSNPTPSVEKKRIENEQLRIDNEQRKQEWSSVCGRVDKRMFKYIVQCLFGGSVMIYSMVQLAVIEESQNREIYISLLSTTLGLFLPSPSNRR